MRMIVMTMMMILVIMRRRKKRRTLLLLPLAMFKIIRLFCVLDQYRLTPWNAEYWFDVFLIVHVGLIICIINILYGAARCRSLSCQPCSLCSDCNCEFVHAVIYATHTTHRYVYKHWLISIWLVLSFADLRTRSLLAHDSDPLPVCNALYPRTYM